MGAVLYTSYLQVLGAVHPPAAHPTKHVYPPPSVPTTFTAGFAAGAIQSIVAAPLDALQARFKVGELVRGKYKTMWQYGRRKLQEVGLRRIFTGTGWSLSFAKESAGCGVFFATFEYFKSQLYYSFLSHYGVPMAYQGRTAAAGTELITPHFALEPSFILLAGVAASITQQTIQYPLGRVQALHISRLERLDRQHDHDPPLSRRQSLRPQRSPKRTRPTTTFYYSAYAKTFQHARHRALQAGGWRIWLFSVLLSSTLRQIPSASAGLFVFELFRRRYGVDGSGALSGHDDDGLGSTWVDWNGRRILLS